MAVRIVFVAGSMFQAMEHAALHRDVLGARRDRQHPGAGPGPAARLSLRDDLTARRRVRVDAQFAMTTELDAMAVGARG